MERTLVVLKPDAVQRGIVGEIITRFEKPGLKIIGMKMVYVTEELASKHYPGDREDFIRGMGNKTLENYKELGIDVKKELGTDDPKEIGDMIRMWLVDSIRSGPVIAMVLQAPEVIEFVRKLVGFTYPLKAAPGTIRSEYSFDSTLLANTQKRPVKNLLHASGNVEEAEFEIGLWFTPDELHDYETIHQKHMI